MKHASTTCAHLTTVGDTLISAMSDADLAARPVANGKTAGWLIGHLCITGDFLRRKCGRPPATPKEWGPKFGPGTVPSANVADYPTVTELHAAFRNVYTDIAAAAGSIGPEALAAPSPFEGARDRFPTMADFAIWMMTGHLGYHLGQLAELRAASSTSIRMK